MFRSRVIAFLPTSSFLLAMIVVGGVRIEATTTFALFDKMDEFDQAEHVAMIVDAAETSLRKAGKPDAAARLEQVFANTASGSATAASEGVAQLEADIDRARNAGASVQQAVFWTMEHFHVDVPPPVVADVNAVPVHRLTYAEFHAKPIEEQRHIIKTYGVVGVLDYFAREMKAKAEKSFFAMLARDKMDSDILDFVRSQFPLAGPQPGFEGSVKRMEPENTGKQGANRQKEPMLGVVLYVMDRAAEITAERNRKLDEHAVMIPDGRLVYPDKNGVYMTFMTDGSSARLEENLQSVARALQSCMERRRLWNRSGLDACRDEAIPVKARLIFGDAVERTGNYWTFANGTSVPSSLLDSRTGTPPLLPRQQYSTKQAPVAGYIQQIKMVVGSVQSCQGLIPWMQIASSHFDMDDHGIVNSWQLVRVNLTDGARNTTTAFGAAIANLDLSEARTSPEGPTCVRVILTCKDDSCVRIGDRADSNWSIVVKNADDSNVVLNALRAIAPYYPDGRGEIK